jgi:two-component system, chemotaxis family, protein-glutamate methylesterase/glutaminase
MTLSPDTQVRADAIAIGTSAGGIEALSAVLPALPATYAGAVFVVLHLPPERPSLLVDVFAPKCALRVREAGDKEPVEGGTIYFAPPDYHLLVDDGPTLALSADEPVNFSRPSIDVLFESAADIYGPRLFGVVLTGGNRDGARGLEIIHRQGGLTCVQEPGSAQVPLMAESALRQSSAHAVLDLGGLASVFRRIRSGAGLMAGGNA